MKTGLQDGPVQVLLDGPIHEVSLVIGHGERRPGKPMIDLFWFVVLIHEANHIILDGLALGKDVVRHIAHGVLSF